VSDEEVLVGREAHGGVLGPVLLGGAGGRGELVAAHPAGDDVEADVVEPVLLLVVDAHVVALIADGQVLTTGRQVDRTAVSDGLLELLGAKLFDEVTHAADTAVVAVADLLERLGDGATELDGVFGFDEGVEFRTHRGPSERPPPTRAWKP